MNAIAEFPRKLSSPYWICQAVGWGGVIALSFLMSLASSLSTERASLVAGGGTEFLVHFWQANSFTVLSCLTGAGVSHFLRGVIRRGDWLSWPLGRIVRHAVGWWGALTLLLALNGALFFAHPAPDEVFAETLTIALMMNACLLGSWIALYLLIHFQRAWSREKIERIALEARHAEAQLRSLQHQMNPHFLFNSLNTIRALIPASADRAREALTMLADTLRATLDTGRTKLIPLRRELEIVHAYLAMERLRFEDDLHIEEEIEAEALAFEIPPLILLTLVENAIKHGMPETGQTCVLRLNVETDGGFLRLRMGNPVENRSQMWGEGTSLGLGLENTRQRLRLIFDERATVTLLNNSPGWVTVEIQIPIATAERGSSRPKRLPAHAA